MFFVRYKSYSDVFKIQQIIKVWFEMEYTTTPLATPFYVFKTQPQTKYHDTK